MRLFKSVRIGKMATILFNIVGLGFVAYVLMVGYFLVAPTWVGSKGYIEALYGEINTGNSFEQVTRTINEQILQDSDDILVAGPAGVFHERDAIAGAKNEIIISGIRGGYHCQGIIYFDENQQVVRKGEILCID